MPPNPNAVPIPWNQFLMLLNACGIALGPPDAQGRYRANLGGNAVMHQLKPSNGHLRRTGWFNLPVRRGRLPAAVLPGYPRTAGGHLWVVMAIDPAAPMTDAGQPEFVRLLAAHGHQIPRDTRE